VRLPSVTIPVFCGEVNYVMSLFKKVPGMLMLSRFRTMLAIGLLFALSSQAAFALADDQRSAVNPSRLSYTTGSVSFWRSGAEDWVEARINTPIISGDALYTNSNAVFELQGEGSTFIRADEKTEMTLVNQTPDFLQIKVTSGRVSLDIRTLPVPGYSIEIDTPNAVFTIDRIGYYRVDVNGEVHFITRRGGAATMTQSKGQALIILPSEEIVVSEGGRAETYVAPEPNAWDRWNDDRSNDLMDAYSDRYITPGVAGARDLDYYGNWRQTNEYGPVWVPDSISVDWAPYSTGRWVWDPYYQWTWIDDAPWGWVPFHYGRWVNYSGYWAWAPGPVMTVRPVYAPALVAFFGVSFGSPGYGWVALSWGEPCVPWWGRRGFVGSPWWGGWGGPRIVNNVHIHQKTVININHINYSNSRIKNAVIATPSDSFGRHHVRDTSKRLPVQSRELTPIRGALPIKPGAGNLVADAPRSMRPPEQITSRPVVATKRPQESKLPWQPETRTPEATADRYVPSPRSTVTDMRRPEPGTQFGSERTRPPLPSRYEDWKRQPAPAAESPSAREPAVVSSPEPRQNRIEPREINESSRWRTPAAPAAPAQINIPDARQQRMEPAVREPSRVMPVPRAEPSRIDRENSFPAPAPIRVIPQERSQSAPAEAGQRSWRNEPMPQQGRAQGGRADLPGMPANRTYRDGGQGRPEQGQGQRQR